MIALLIILSFELLNAARGQGWLPRWVMCALMAALWGYVYGLNTFPGYVQIIALFGCIYGAFLPGWSLSAITGTFNGISAENDWNQKFKPSGFTINRLKLYNLLPKALQSEYAQGAIGMAARWLLFIPAVVIVQGWIGLLYGVVLAILAGFAYYIAGRVLRHSKYAGYATRLAEFLSGMALGGALIV